MIDWIEMREQKPKEGQDVIFYHFIEGDVLAGYYAARGFFAYDDSEQQVIGYFDDEITHWTPLPKAPVFSKDEEARLQGFESHKDMLRKFFGDDYNESLT